MSAQLQGARGTDPASSAALGHSLGMAGGGTVLALAAMLLAGAGATLWNLDRLTTRLVEQQALQDATALNAAISEFRTLYTSEVVRTVQEHGLDVTHDYADRDAAIPLPATLAMRLGNVIGSRSDGATVSLYSPYPFPWRERVGLDDFSKEAWSVLNGDPSTPFVQFESATDSAFLRFATSDVMRRECVDCHNSHPETPKSDWKEGDVRGVLEVSVPLNASVAGANLMLQETLALIVGLITLALAGLVITIRRLRRYAAEEHRLQGELNEQLTKALSGFIPICAWCKKIREGDSAWTPVERYIAERTEAEFSHGMCDECQRTVAKEQGGA